MKIGEQEEEHGRVSDCDRPNSGPGPLPGGLCACRGRADGAVRRGYLLRAPGAEVLEGDHPGGSVVVSKWPDKAAALAFWHSPEYAEAKQLREGVADCQVLVVEEPSA